MVAAVDGDDVMGAHQAITAAEWKEFLEKESNSGCPALLVVDAAQDLGVDTLEEIQSLSILENQNGPLLEILLVAQPRFWTVMERPELRVLKERFARPL